MTLQASFGAMQGFGNMTHHPFSPSVLARRKLCPGSYYSEIDLPEIETEEAQEGIKAHKIMAKQGLSSPILEAEADGAEWNLRVQIDKALDFRKHLIKEASQVFTEEHLELHFNDQLLTSDIADLVAIFSDGHVKVVDWQFGRSPLPQIAANMQLMTYAAMIFQRWREIQSVEAIIYQPRFSTTYKTVYLRDKLLDILNAVLHIIDTAKTLPLSLAPSVEACAYCKAVTICPAAEAKARLERKNC